MIRASTLEECGFREHGAQGKCSVASILAEFQLARECALTLEGEIFALRQDLQAAQSAQMLDEQIALGRRFEMMMSLVGRIPSPPPPPSS